MSQTTKFTAVSTAAIAAILGFAHPALGQVVERHEAPGLQQAPAPPVATPEPPANQDTTPLGANLTSVVLLKADAPAAGSASEAAAQMPLPDAPNRAALDRKLARFDGQPLSRALIARIEAVVVDHYRQAGRPFVAVKLPPQDATQGVLRLVVVEFRLGRKTAQSASPAVDRSIEAGVRASAGDRIDAPELQQDLDWLNHSPFRSVTAVFSPGQDLGVTNLDLQARAGKPWQAFVGYDNSGTPSSGLDRWSLGAEIGDLITPGSLISYQLTTSDDYWVNDTGPFGNGEPQYVSHSLIVGLPLAPRQDFTLVTDYIDSTTSPQAFKVRSQTEEISGVYRTALSNFSPLPGDLSLGVEAHGQQTSTYFAGAEQVGHAVVVEQALVGWSDAWSSLAATQTLSVTAHISPGGLGIRNTNADVGAFSSERVVHADYAYADIDYRGDFRIAGEWRYVLALSGQVADHALVDTEQMAVGGSGGVRGYVYDDGAFDTGIIARNELRAPAEVLNTGPIGGLLLPYAYFDAGYAGDRGDQGPDTYQYASGAGLGADWRLGPHFTGGLSGGWALNRAIYTPAGTFKLLANARLTF